MPALQERLTMDASSPPPLCDEHALFLDFDGVLVDFAPRPDLVKMKSDVVDALQAARRGLDGALAVVTGRNFEDIDRFVPLSLPGAGNHGRQLRMPGGFTQPVQDAELDREFEAIEAFVAGHPGTRSERKPGGVGVHYREAPHAEDDARAMMEALEAERDDLKLMRGKMIFELKEAHVHKGLGVEKLMAVPPFAGRVPVFVGDDVTDEDGFRAVQERGGFGIKVGEGETVAHHRVPDLRTIHEWLKTYAAQCRRARWRTVA